MKLRLFALAALLLATGFAQANGDVAKASAELAKAKNCMNCHQVARKMVGPAFKDVAARYAQDKDAATKLAKKIVEGGRDSWGPLAMPANPQLKPEEALALARWVLATPR